MANLKEVRTRISSVSSTQQITRAMKMVSAAKLRKAQDAIISLRPYASKLKEILTNLSATLDSSEGIYSRQRELKNVLLIVITSNRGLCGAFNSNVIKLTKKQAYDKYKDQFVSTLCIGKKGADYFKKTELGITAPGMPKNLHVIYDKLTFENVVEIMEKVIKLYIDGEFDRVDIVYNQFKNASVQILVAEQFLPIPPPEKKEEEKDLSASFMPVYIFEPDREKIVQELIPKSLKVQFYKSLLDSVASEHGAGMTAMHMATENAEELLKNLKSSYNKARQAAITKEILEIVGGAEALSN